jgi:hypothetical protein
VKIVTAGRSPKEEHVSANRLIVLGLALVVATGVALAGVGRHRTRPRPSTGIPDREYQFRSRSQPKIVASNTQLPLVREERDILRRKTIRYYQLRQPKVEIDHCSISRVVLQLHDDGGWVVSLRADQNPVTEEGVQPATTEQGRYTAHIKRNRFHVEFRCLGVYQDEPQEGDPNRPLLFNVELKPFWVQKGRPYALFERGDLGGDQQYFALVDRVELEFAIETVAQR